MKKVSLFSPEDIGFVLARDVIKRSGLSQANILSAAYIVCLDRDPEMGVVLDHIKIEIVYEPSADKKE